MRHRFFQWITVAIMVLFLAACGSAPDEEAPELTMDETPSRTNDSTVPISGTVEPGATLQVATTAQPDPRIVEPGELDEDGRLIWNTEIDLKEEDGANRISVSAFDRVGNTRIIHRTVVKDTSPPQVSDWRWDGDSALLVIVFDELVKVDTLVNDFSVFDAVANVDIPGVLQPDIAEDQADPEYWRSFIWTPNDPWTPGESYSFSVPAGIADDLGNVADEPQIITGEPDEADPELP